MGFRVMAKIDMAARLMVNEESSPDESLQELARCNPGQFRHQITTSTAVNYTAGITKGKSESVN
jgi:hypothetical protein